MNTFVQIFRNTLTGWVAVFLRTLIALAMVPFLIRHLGLEGYGLVGLLIVITSMVDVADLGLRGALGRELAEHASRGEQKAFDELLSSAAVLYVLLGSVLAFSLWMIAPWLVTVFKVSPAMQAEMLVLIRVFGCGSLFLSFVSPIFSSALSSHNRFDVVNSVMIIEGVVSSLFLFVVIPQVENPLYGWVGVMLTHQLLTVALLAYFFHRFCPQARPGWRLINPARLRPLLRLSGSMYALQMAQTLSERSDPLVISYFFGPSGVGLYHPGGRLSAMIRPVVLTLANQMYPLTTKQHVTGGLEKMTMILLMGTRFTLLMGSLTSVLMLVFAHPFCRLWLYGALGENYRIPAYVMMGWALADLLMFAAGTQWAVLLGMKRLKLLVWTQLPTALLNLGVSIYLVGYTSLGIPGALVATIMIGMIRRPILIFYTAHCCNLSVRRYWAEAYSRPLISLAVTLAAAVLARFLMAEPSLIKLGLSAVFVIMVWLPMVWWVGMTVAERTVVRSELIRRCMKTKSV